MNIQRGLNKDIEPDEIFIDYTNLSSLNNQQFEGRLEKPISKKIVFLTSIFFLSVVFLFLWKLWMLQIENGDMYFRRSQVNSLKKINFTPERGVIYDRNGKMLAWNEEVGRAYAPDSGIYNVLGYLGYPSKDETESFGILDPKEFVGKEGIEKIFNSYLRGKDGVKIIETDVRGNIQSESLFEPGIKGEDVYLSLDSTLSNQAYEIIRKLAEEKGFLGGSLVMMNIENGEILAMASYPEYNSNDFSKKNDEKISSYLKDKRMPFLNRTVAGLYAPGSIMKPIFALGALNDGLVKPEKEIYSAGFISIPNPYYPDKPSVFKDWKAHGYTDMRKAIAVSSDVYFYAIGGGYEGQKGLGIERIEYYSRLFGIGTTTGVELYPEGIGNIPSPKWKKENFNGDEWTLGNTYHSSIGQYGFQVTPIQMVRAIGALANDGKMVRPTILKNNSLDKNFIEREINISADKFKVIKEGMRMSVTEGTSQGINLPQIEIAAKTGTAEIGTSAKKYVNSWNVGFFPYKEPKYAYAVVMERGPIENTVGGVYVMRSFFDWMILNNSPYVKND